MNMDLIKQVREAFKELRDDVVEEHTFQDDQCRTTTFDFSTSWNEEKLFVMVGIRENLANEDDADLFVTVFPQVELDAPDSPELMVAINEINSWLPVKAVIALEDGFIAEKGDLFVNKVEPVCWLKPLTTDLLYDLMDLVISAATIVVGELKEKGIRISVLKNNGE